MFQTIATIIALLIAVAAITFTSVVMYKIFLANRPKKEKPPKVSKADKKQKLKEQKAAPVDHGITLSARESKVTGFELDDDD